MTIYTIGYEGATMDDFLAALRRAGVERVIDVRALPLSRRPGFSKNSLAATLREHGIDYVHLKALGTPKPGRDAAKKGDWRTMEAVYAGQLELPEAQAQAAQLRMLAEEKCSAVLCYERDRSIATARCCCVTKARGRTSSTSRPDRHPATGSFTAPFASRSSGP